MSLLGIQRICKATIRLSSLKMLNKSTEGAQRLDSGTLILIHGYGLKEAQVMSDIIFFLSNPIKLKD